MADVIETKKQIQMEFAFVDGDTRLVYINNPKDTVTTQEIEDLNTYIRANNLIIGDRYQSTFAQINKATKIIKVTRTLDLNP